MATLVARISGRVFVGPDLNRDEDWLKMSTTFARDVFAAGTSIRTWRPSLRWIGKYFVPEIRRIHAHNARAIAFIGKILKQRAYEEQDEGYEKPVDAIEWVRDAIPEKQKEDIRFQALLAMSLVAAAINTTSGLITNVIFDLSFRPEYVEILREEATEVLSASGGHWTAESMNQLKKLDSFVKESQRLAGAVGELQFLATFSSWQCTVHAIMLTAVTVSFNRKTVKDITLSDGTLLPRNTYLVAPALAVSADPSLYPNADSFDGLRFYNLRQQSLRDEYKYQFSTIDKHMLHFGAGRHACPGRWFAGAEIKLIMATLILQYDMKLKDGVRPKSIQFQAQQAPNPMAEVLFKRREV
jgi:cytochrome P450